MAMPIFLEKENGELGTTTTTKDRLRVLSAPSKTFAERSHSKTPLVGRTANVNAAASKGVRKALRDLNKPQATGKGEFPKGQKSMSTKRASEKTSRLEGCSMVTEDWPEKENLISYNPLEFENFEVPEEHRLSHLSLTGVPLMTFGNVPDIFTSPVLVPIKPPSLSWDYDTLQSRKDFLATLDEIIIDLPPPL